jgi:hypothetical protein
MNERNLASAPVLDYLSANLSYLPTPRKIHMLTGNVFDVLSSLTCIALRACTLLPTCM